MFQSYLKILRFWKNNLLVVLITKFYVQFSSFKLNDFLHFPHQDNSNVIPCLTLSPVKNINFARSELSS